MNHQTCTHLTGLIPLMIKRVRQISFKALTCMLINLIAIRNTLILPIHAHQKKAFLTKFEKPLYLTPLCELTLRITGLHQTIRVNWLKGDISYDEAPRHTM